MEIRTIHSEGVTLVTMPVERLDASNAYEFKEKVAIILKENRKVVFDLGQLEFMDSSGLGAMIACFRQVTGNGGNLILCNIRKSVRLLFETVRMNRVMDIVNTSEDAIRSFRV